MRPEALMLLASEPTSVDDRAVALLAHYGVRTRTATFDALPRLVSAAEEGRAPLPPLVIVNAWQAVAADERGPGMRQAVTSLRDAHVDVLLFGMSAAPEIDRLLSELSDGVLRGVVPPPDGPRSYRVREAELAGVLGGLTIESPAATRDVALDLGSGSQRRVERLIDVNDEPLFVRLPFGSATLYVLAVDDVLDLDEPTPRLDDREHFSAFIPILMLLRQVYGLALWHANESFANLIIDDPMLTPTYGYLDYRRLLRDMDSRDFTTTIAFIPYNYRRSRPATSQMFRARADRYALCVHGSDHTRGEFAHRDPVALMSNIVAARTRMDSHRRRAGVDYDRVMVFPQGRFSSEAMRALKAAGFAAAANSGPKAVDDERPFTAREFLDVAVTRYSDLPLFLRRYPDEPAEFAIDAFLGRPALIVSHPGDFRDGYRPIERAVTALNTLAVQPDWRSLGVISRELYVRRTVGEDRVHARVLSPVSVLRNPSSAEECWTVVASDAAGEVRAVLAAGVPVPFRRYGGRVFFRLTLPPESEIPVVLRFGSERVRGRRRRSVGQRTRVVGRRFLCEARDRYLIKSQPLYGLAKRLAGR